MQLPRAKFHLDRCRGVGYEFPKLKILAIWEHSSRGWGIPRAQFTRNFEVLLIIPFYI